MSKKLTALPNEGTLTAPQNEGTLEPHSSRVFFYRALLGTSKFALVIALLVLGFLLFFALSFIPDGGAAPLLGILSAGLLTSIIFFFFLSIASIGFSIIEIGFSLIEMEDKLTTQNTLIKRQLEIQQRLLEIQLEMLEDSQKDSEID